MNLDEFFTINLVIYIATSYMVVSCLKSGIKRTVHGNLYCAPITFYPMSFLEVFTQIAAIYYSYFLLAIIFYVRPCTIGSYVAIAIIAL